jgi:pimeloyl-ACP methyl ester carboxylesterase
MALLEKPATWARDTVEVRGTKLEILTLGTGEPLLLLHDEMGAPDVVSPAYRTLAEEHRLVLPAYPGFGASQRLDWLMSVQDLAVWYLQALRELNLGPTHVVGVSLGGWLAAEMAAMSPDAFKKLVLVGPMGVKPSSGEILDLFVITAKEYFATWFEQPDRVEGHAELFGDEMPPERSARIEDAREAAVRLAWKPYMHNPSLPYLLRGIRNPTLVVSGRQDAVVPLSAAEEYARLIPGARLEIVDDVGHRPDLEQPAAFTTIVQTFFAGA